MRRTLIVTGFARMNGRTVGDNNLSFNRLNIFKSEFVFTPIDPFDISQLQ